MGRLTRRSVLGGIAGLGSAAAWPNSVLPATAARKKTPYGIAVELGPFRKDPLYRAALIKYADILVPMNALKWGQLRYDKARFDFSGADEIIEFAKRHGKTIRGHNLLWYNYNPKWVDAITTARDAEKVLVEHIERVVDRYRGTISSWDVVNEVLAHNPLEQGRWRKGVWFSNLGARQMEIAFAAAARTDPAAQLVINDYDLENIGPRFDARREAILQIIRNLQDQNIPVHGVGFQAHLYPEREIDQPGMAAFLQKLQQLGIKILVTELDVIDWKLSRNLIKRDIGTASITAEFLRAIYSQGPIDSISTWGITDRYSWISDVFKRKDGAPNRPLPLDRNYQPKPMFDIIEKYRESN